MIALRSAPVLAPEDYVDCEVVTSFTLEIRVPSKKTTDPFQEGQRVGDELFRAVKRAFPDFEIHLIEAERTA